MRYTIEVKSKYNAWTGLKAEHQEEHKTNKIINNTLTLYIEGITFEITFKKNKKKEKNNEKNNNEKQKSWPNCFWEHCKQSS